MDKHRIRFNTYENFIQFTQTNRFKITKSTGHKIN